MVERWATDEAVLGGGCHDDHRCRLCQEYSPLPVPRPARRQQADANQPDRGDSKHSDEPEVPGPVVRAGEPQTKARRHYNHEAAEFILEPISDSVVRVTHREQTGYFGVAKDWEAARPYTWTASTSDAREVDGVAISYSTPEAALDPLCGLLLNKQHKKDSRRINPEQRKRAARKVLGEFLEELPD